jgi:hypothetical protein
MTTFHQLKTHPPPFEDVWQGRKPYEVRNDDRKYAVGDVLILREWDPDTLLYSGRIITASVTYKTEGGRYGLPPELCVLGIRVVRCVIYRADLLGAQA